MKLLLLGLFVQALAVPFHSGLTLKIDAHSEYCVYDDVERLDEKVFMSFQVTAGGALDIDVHVHAPDFPELWAVERETDGRILFKAPSTGQYKFCFSNKMSTLTPKTVQFSIMVGDPTDPVIKQGPGPLKFAAKQRPDPVERSIIRLREGLREIREEQDYLRTRERTHRDTAESTNARVLWWSLGESCILVFMSLGQVFYLRRCFEVKRKV